MMEFNSNPEIALFVSCILSSRIHFPVLRPEREVKEGADALCYFILKAGIRQCNFDYFWTGKTIAKNLFFSKNHPLYRKLTLYLDFDLAQMPETMYYQYKSTVGVKVEGKGGSEASRCENFDYVIEWCNKALKQHLSWAPTHKTWLTACRLYNFMR